MARQTLAVAAALILAAPAGAVGELPAAGSLPAPPPAIAASLDRAAEIRTMAEAGPPGAPLRALLHAAEVGVEAEALPAPGARELAATAGLRPDLRSPVAGLLAAVRRAEAMLAGPTPEEVRRGVAALKTHARRLARRDLTEEGVRPPEAPVLPRSIRRSARRTPEAVALLSAALDRWLPALRAAAPVPGDGAGCDVLDELPLLCVGSDASNTYTEHAMLLVDLGGDDLHLHPAGAAPFVADGETFMVSVTIDLGGDDRYVARPIPGVAASPSSQGYGAVGGVGILVDVEGDDRYEAAAPPTTPEALDTAVYAQGVGIGAGYGALIDLDGSDRYTITASDGVEDTMWMYGQGVGYVLGAAGALVDLGGGDDTYVLDGGTVDGLVREWTFEARRHNRQVQGQGSSYTGAGLLLDDGGTDAIVAEAHARSRGGAFLLDPEWERPELPPAALVPIAHVWAQGAGIFGGAAYLLAGDGATRYEAEATGDPTAQGSLLVQGFGFLGGAGALDDLGGDDLYSARVTTSGQVRVAVEEGDPARAVLEPFVSSVSAQGWGGSAGGVGVLRDHGGDDRYVVENLQEVALVVEDDRDPSPGPARADLSVWPPPAMGQGWGTIAGAGALLDADGTDAYRLESRLDAHTEAGAPGADGESVATALVYPRLFALGGQGAARAADASYGALLDLGGVGDRMEARAETNVTTAPDPDRVRTVGFLWPPFQGSGESGVFAALGEAPAVRSSPSQGVCALSTGSRGFGTWSECGLQGADPDRQYFDAPAQQQTQSPPADQVAVGMAPRASGGLPSLALLPEVPATVPAGGSVEVGARLAEPGVTPEPGAPIEGAPLRFNLQFSIRGIDGVEPSWFNGWEVVAATDADGVARARLPVELDGLEAFLSSSFPGPDQWRLRILASFDGAEGLQPRRTARTVELG